VNDFYLFVTAQFAFFDKHLAFRDAELFSEIFYQMGVRLAVNGRAVMATLSSSPCRPTMLSRLAFG
jgi:hypothetical protein